MQPRTPRSSMSVAQQLDLGSGGHAIERGETAAVGKRQTCCVTLDLAREKIVQQRARVRRRADRLAFRTASGIPEQELGVMVDALPVHGGDEPRERRREQARDGRRIRRRLAESDPAVDADTAGDERVPERAGGEARGILDDVHVPPCPGPRADRSTGGNRSVASLSEGKAGAATGDGADGADERNRVVRRLERGDRGFSGRRWSDRYDDEIVVQRKRRDARGVGCLEVPGEPAIRNLLIVEG